MLLRYKCSMNDLIVETKNKINKLIEELIDEFDFKKIEKTKISNTNYLKNLDILILEYGLNGVCYKIILSSVTKDKMYNISGLFKYLKIKLKNTNCIFKESDSYVYNNGFGISENLLHNKYLYNIKNIIDKNRYLKSYID